VLKPDVSNALVDFFDDSGFQEVGVVFYVIQFG